MDGNAGWPLALLGIMLLGGYLAYVTAARISVPRVTILIVVGALVGPSVLDLVPHDALEWFPFVAHIALAMVGFLLGENFVGKQLREKGRTILWIMVGETVMTALFVFAGLWVIAASLPLALVLAGIAPASDPAAIFETAREGKAKGPLTATVLGVVAIDDAWGVIMFSVLLILAKALGGTATHGTALLNGLWEIFGAVILGGVIGLAMSWVTSRVRGGEPTLLEAAGFVFLCSGVATVIHVSYLLSAMVMGAVVANRTKHRARPFHAIEGVSEPFLAIFFILAGIKLELSALMGLGLVGALYIVARAAGLITGAWVAGKLAGAPAVVQKRLGFCILPQAGVALGFALLIQEQLPQLGEVVLPLVIATTVLFEISGPLIARWQLRQAGELQDKET